MRLCFPDIANRCIDYVYFTDRVHRVLRELNPVVRHLNNGE